MYPNFEKFTLIKQTETTTSDSTGNNTVLAASGQILNCPFCGALCEIESKTFGDSMKDYFRVGCKSHYNHSLDSWQDTSQMAINEWNLRQAAGVCSGQDKTT